MFAGLVHVDSITGTEHQMYRFAKYCVMELYEGYGKLFWILELERIEDVGIWGNVAVGYACNLVPKEWIKISTVEEKLALEVASVKTCQSNCLFFELNL